MLFLEKYYKGADVAQVKARLEKAAALIGCTVSDLDTCIFLESSWNPKAYNSASGAYGLIQWLNSTALNIHKVQASYIGEQGAYTQVAYVEHYFVTMKQRLKVTGFANVYELYLTIFYPVAVGKPDTYVLLQSTQKGYSGNRSLDYNKDGKITKAEVKTWVDSALKKKASLQK